MPKFIDVRPESGEKFFRNFDDTGKVVMLNLLKFKPKADYSGLEHLKPEPEITGEEAYQLYMRSTLPELEKAGSRIIFYGKCGDFVIGPQQEKWDALLLVEHGSVSKFIAFAQNESYLRTAGHRTAALEDSRLLPSTEIKSYI